MNAVPISNSRYTVILIAIIIAILLVLALNSAVLILLMGNMMRGGMMNHMMGMNGQTMNDMLATCTNTMQNLQSP